MRSNIIPLISAMQPAAPTCSAGEIAGLTKEQRDELAQLVCSTCKFRDMCKITRNRDGPKYHTHLADCTVIKRSSYITELAEKRFADELAKEDAHNGL